MRSFLALALLLLAVSQSGEASAMEAAVNPIRRVVTMLQMMQKKVTAEGEKEKELYEKFMCYCKNGVSALEKSIADANTKVPELQSDIEEAEALKAQLEEEVKQHKQDREDAKAAMKEATAIREKEKAAFEKETAEARANLDAIKRAIAALEKGMAGTFLQTGGAAVLRRLTLSSALDISDDERELLTSFLGARSSEDYAPQSGEIVGILKQMGDTMLKDLQDAIDQEEKAIEVYNALMEAKKKEIEAATEAIEQKLQRIGELGIEIVNMKEDLSDTEEALIEDQKYLADLQKNCATKTEEWEERCKMRTEELLALAETIKILNDDDALELFKKTLSSPSLLQITVRASSLRQRALALIREASRTAPSDVRSAAGFIETALTSKKISFEKVIQMIDDMVVLLGKEQAEDDEKKEYCEVQIDAAEDTAKEIEHAVDDLEKAIEDAKSGIETLAGEIKALEEGIIALDKMVVEATEQRKEENEDFTELMASNTAAKELIGIAKNRMNKFYNPKLYKPPPKRELSEQDRIAVNMGGTAPPTQLPGGIAGTGIGAFFAQVSKRTVIDEAANVAPPPPPETYGAYAKKAEESGGVIAMMDMLVAELTKEMTEAETNEKLAQEDYETLMKDSATKRAEDSKAIEDKMSAKAGMEADLEQADSDKAAKLKELMATHKYLEDLHLECDWLTKNYDLRKEARASEIDALKKAKAVLSGADYSLVQTAVARRSLRGQ